MPVHPPATVLVLDADMTSALAVVRSLAGLGLQVDVADAGDDGLARYSRHARKCLDYPDPLIEPQRFSQWLRQQLESGDYRLVIPVTERSATAAMPLLDDPDIAGLIALPSRASLQIALDKERTMALASELKVPIPDSWPIRNEQDLASIPADCGFPMVVKPSRSIGGNGGARQQLTVTYAFDSEDLAAKVRHYLLFGEVLVQQYFAGDGVGIELIAKEGELVLPFQHKRLHEVPLTGGGSSLRESVPLHLEMLNAARKMIRAMRWHGVAMVEFKHDPHTDRFALMEINGRFWGSLPLSIAAGADFPALLYRLMVDGDCGPLPEVRDRVIARKLSADLDWMEQVVRRDCDSRVVSFPSRRKMVSDLLLTFSPRHHFDVQSWRDLRPGWVDLKRIAAYQVQRLGSLYSYRRALKQQQRAWRGWLSSGKLAGVQRVLFLCYGNINRSALAQRCWETRHGSTGPQVRSAGFHTETGRPADPVMQRLAAERGVDLSGWSSHCVDTGMARESDLILVMEITHRERLLGSYPDLADRVLLLGMVPGSQSMPEIADPYGQPPAAYGECLQHICLTIDRLHDLLAGTGERTARNASP